MKHKLGFTDFFLINYFTIIKNLKKSNIYQVDKYLIFSNIYQLDKYLKKSNIYQLDKYFELNVMPVLVRKYTLICLTKTHTLH